MVTDETDDERQAQIDRVAGQLHTNDQCTPIIDRHRVGAVTELLDLGLGLRGSQKASSFLTLWMHDKSFEALVADLDRSKSEAETIVR